MSMQSNVPSNDGPNQGSSGGAPGNPGAAATEATTQSVGDGSAAAASAAAAGAATAAPKPPVRTNLPMKTGPIVGRKAEMQAIAQAFEKARQAARPGRVEVVGRTGVGATSVALELARRAGARMPGGAWYIDASMGADLAWADLGSARGDTHVKDLAAAARAAREKLAEGNLAILVIDGVRSAEDLLACMPLESRTPPYVFVVCEKATGITDDVVNVGDVPPHGARRIAEAMIRGAEGQTAPAVRVLDGLGITSSLGARVSLAWQGKHGPVMLEDTFAAVQRFVPLLANRPATLEILLMASVMHPSHIAVDALFSAVGEVRKGRGGEPNPQEIGEAVLMLAQAGLVSPDDDRRISVHPLVQQVVQRMAQSEADLAAARHCVATALAFEAEHAIEPEGVRIAVCGLHQLRHIESQVDGELQAKVKAARAKLEQALAIAS